MMNLNQDGSELKKRFAGSLAKAEDPIYEPCADARDVFEHERSTELAAYEPDVPQGWHRIEYISLAKLVLEMGGEIYFRHGVITYTPNGQICRTVFYISPESQEALDVLRKIVDPDDAGPLRELIDHGCEECGDPSATLVIKNGTRRVLCDDCECPK